MITKITDKKNLKNLGILLFRQEDIQQITKLSGPLAKSNEYQVHYWFFNIRVLYADNSHIDIAIPTAYFNYTQQVSSASVSFDLAEVDNVSEIVQPKAEQMAKDILEHEDFMAKLQVVVEALGEGTVDIQFNNVNLGTIHRHPGSLTSFSGTDLAKDPKDPGICYPFGELVDDVIAPKPSFSSIMIHKGNETFIGHTEYRTAVQQGSTLAYEKHRCLTTVHYPAKKLSQLEASLAIPAPSKHYALANSLPTADGEIALPEKLSDALADLRNLVGEFAPSTEHILKDNVETFPTRPSMYNTKTLIPGYRSSFTTGLHKNSKAYKQIVLDAEAIYGIHIFSATALKTMTQDALNRHYTQLEKVYYDTDLDTEATNIDIEVIQDLYEDIILEVGQMSQKQKEQAFKDRHKAKYASDEPQVPGTSYTVADMREELISWGMTITQASQLDSDTVIRYWKSVQSDIEGDL